MKRMLSLLVVCLLLTGCQKNVPEATVEPVIWETVPALEYGVMESDTLKVEPWYCGRAEFTGRNRWAETELGYYFMYAGNLYYADKVNLANWVPVCNQPNCRHSLSWSYGQVKCNAQLGGNEFLIRDGRIIFEADVLQYQELVPGTEFGLGLFSRALDGTQPKLEYISQEFRLMNGYSISHLSDQQWLVCVGALQPDGTTLSRLWQVTDEGLTLLAETRKEDSTSYLLSDMYLVNYQFEAAFGGERFYMMELFREAQGDPVGTVYCFRDGTPTAVNAVDFATLGKYLAGDTLRLYREDLGYYDLDLNTRQQTKIAEAALSDADCVMPLPNCLLEMKRGEMVLYDGETWKPVVIPEEWKNREFTLEAVASDRIFLTLGPEGLANWNLDIFQIRLDGETLELEYCGKIGLLE